MMPPPNPADRVGQIVPPFEDRMLLAWTALQISREQQGAWTQHTVVDAVDLFAVDVEEFDAMTNVLIHAAESAFG